MYGKVCPNHQERSGRYFSEEHKVWYDVYPCETHGEHLDIDFDKVW